MAQPQEFDEHRKSAYIWNTAGSLLNAFQSVFMLMALTRMAPLEVAGVFTLAYASANLFLNMGNYGMRNFQASDVIPVYPFASYWRSRLITDVAMLVCSCVYLCWSATMLHYSVAKTAAIFCMALLKLVDSVEDICDGNCQQHGRLDVAGKLLTFRTASLIVVFVCVMVLTRNLVQTLALTTLWSASFLLVGLGVMYRRLGLPTTAGDPEVWNPWHGALELLKECFPLFLAAFLLFYVGNAPKYAIDAQLDDAMQAIYGFLAMPVFVVGLFAQFVYMPLVEPLSRQWASGEFRLFKKAISQQILVIVGLTVACDMGAALLGEPVLGWLYATNLQGYGVNLVILVSGGGLLAIAQLFTMAITVMRRQNLLSFGYIGVAVLALLSSTPVVAHWGIDGASWVYLAYMLVLMVIFGSMFYLCIQQAVHRT